jgi:outer membrane immunogenic protein
MVLAALSLITTVGNPNMSRAETQLDEVLQRLARLEKENDSLKQQVRQLAANRNNPPSVAAEARAPKRAASPPASTEAGPPDASSARAQWLPAKAPPQRVALANWSGFYVGGSAGGGVASLPVTELDGGFDLGQYGSSLKNAGGLVGVQAGYNWQLSSSYLVGVEADINWSGLKASAAYCITTPSQCEQPPNIGTRGFVNVSSRLDYLSTLRARFGIWHDDTLAYVTAGAALGRIKSDYSISDPPAPGGILKFSATDSSDHFGIAAGAGIEHKITDNLSFRAEYLYVSLNPGTFRGNCTATINNCSGNELQRLSYGNSMSASFARVGVNYLFNK